jgi:hypothetical protein
MPYINLYTEQLTKIAQIIDGLNKIEGEVGYDSDSPGMNAMLPYKIPIVNDDEELLGFAVDEIGGVYSFLPATNEDFEKHRSSKI